MSPRLGIHGLADSTSRAIELVRYIWHHPSNRRRRLAAILHALAWQIEKRLTQAPRVLRLPHDLRVSCYPDSTAASHLVYTHGCYDYHETRFIEHYLRPGDSFIDAGANIGTYTLLAARLVGPTGSVDSFEPDQRAYKRLADNITQNVLANVRVHRFAVSDISGMIVFIPGNDQTGRVARSRASTGVELPACRLDDLVGQRRYAMAKMDIEGSELAALKGATRMLAEANPPVWQLECVPRLLHPMGVAPADIAALLQTYDYELAFYDADERRIVWDNEAWRRRKNILAIHRGGRSMVLSRLRGEA